MAAASNPAVVEDGALVEQLQALVMAMDEHSIVSISDAAGDIVYANDRFCQVSGYSLDELLGQNHRIVKSSFHPPEFFQTMWATISAGQVWHGEVKNRGKHDRHYWVETTIVPVMDGHGLPNRYISVRTEITQLMELEEAVRQANAILQVSVIERTLELEQAKLQLEQELAERRHTQEALQQSYDELKALHQQLQAAQQHLMQSEKLAAIGQLAAGMAHEINNPIGFIASNLSTLGNYQQTLGEVLSLYRQCEANPADAGLLARIAGARQRADLDFLLEDTRALIEETRVGIERVRKIVQSLRDFSSIDSAGQWLPVDLNRCFDATLDLLGERCARGIEIRREYDVALPLVECRPAELNQVLFNLLDNALLALPDGGHITLRSGQLGELVWVEVEDSGVGIAEETLAHIFEPFFTTRPVGQGAGLGLSTAYGVVQQHQGQISVRSVPGRGSVFRVGLPLRQATAAGGEAVRRTVGSLA